MLNIAQIIAKKRDSQELSDLEIDQFVRGFAEGSIPDYQMSALAMAILCRGMNSSETTSLTRAMIRSGEPLRWENSERPKVDKHSTGGIGDKISIPLTPILACLGMDVPMISGRGLGPTGGTLDKLESIPGFQVNIARVQFQKQIQETGCGIIAAGNDLAPADKKLYALRDVTGTVPSLSLITSSILSKKVSEGLDALVMDVKVGSGAFMKTTEEAEKLAQSLIDVAATLGVPTTAILTNMDRPLGKMIGNACEIAESIDILKGSGPEDVRELTLQIAAESYHLTQLGTVKEGYDRAVEVIQSGEGLEKLNQMVHAQEGNLDQFSTEFSRQPILAKETGIIQGFDSEKFGYAVIEMGGGRKKQGDKLNYRPGIELLVEEGAQVEKGQPLVNLLDFSESNPLVEKLVLEGFLVKEKPAESKPLIQKTLRPNPSVSS